MAGKSWKKNTYRVRGDVAYLDLRREGEIVARAKIDRDDLDLVLQRYWSVNRQTGYVQSWGGGGGPKNLYLHRLLAGTQGTKFWTDHMNGDKLDNRRSNLRAVTAPQSQINKRTKRGPLRSVYKTNDGKWVASVSKTFEKIEDAQKWRDAVQAHVHGINFMVGCGLWGQLPTSRNGQK